MPPTSLLTSTEPLTLEEIDSFFETVSRFFFLSCLRGPFWYEVDGTPVFQAATWVPKGGRSWGWYAEACDALKVARAMGGGGNEELEAFIEVEP